MAKFKKALLLAMSFVMTACMFVACGDKKKDESTKDSTPPTTSSEQTPDSSVEETPAESEEPETSVAPEVSEEPETSEAPEVSEEPEASEEPETSEEPEVTKYVLTLINGHPMMPGAVTTEELEEGAAIELEDLTADGKTFLGWKAMDIETGEYMDAPTAMPAEDVTLWATWEVHAYDLTLNLPDETTKVVKIGVEEVYDEEEPIIGIDNLEWALEGILSDLGGRMYEYTIVEDFPETWELKAYTFTVEATQIDDADYAGAIQFFDRVNVWLKQPDGTIKENKDNYWDGSWSTVKTENQSEVTYGEDSKFAMKVSFDPNLLTEEEVAAAEAAWGGWTTAADGRDTWASYAISVDWLNLNKTTVTFDMKVDNMNADLIVYGVKFKPWDVEGEYVYEVGKNITLKASEAEDLGDGWLRYTLDPQDVQDELDASNMADFFVFSLDNTQAGYDKTKASVAYIDNVTFTPWHTVTIDEKEVLVKDGAEYTPVEPTMDGYKFIGWADADGNTVNNTFVVEEDMAIFAQWEKLPLVAFVNQIVDIDITNLPLDEDYEECYFTAPAGTYNVMLTGGLKAYTIEAGVMTDNEVTQLVFTEETTVIFAVTFGDNLESIGTISITKNNIEGLVETKIAGQVVKDGYGTSAPERAWVNGSTPEVLTEGIPEGFNVLNKFTWYKDSTSLWKAGYNETSGNRNNPFYRSCYDQTDISGYQVVRFMIKVETEGDAEFEFANGKKINNEWITFELIQTEQNVWTVLALAEDGSILFVKEGATKVTNGLDDRDSIASLVFPSLWVGSTKTHATVLHPATTKDYDVYVYTTEVLAYREYTEIDPEIPAEAVKVRDSIWRANDWALAETNEPAPTGFTMVEMFDWNGNTANGGSNWGGNNKDMQLTCLDEAVVSNYSAVYFAMKMSGGTGFYVRAAQAYTGSGWLYFYLVRQNDDTWNLSLRSSDDTYKAIDVHTGLVGDSLQVLLAYSGTNGAKGSGCYPTKADGDTTSQVYVYMTDMRAIEKPFDPQIAANAKVVSTSAIVDAANNANLTPATNEAGVAAPVGFSKVTNFFSASGNTWGSKILSPADFASENLTAFSEVWFAIAIEGGHFTQTAPSWTDIDSDATSPWINFHLIQEDDGQWTIEITKDGVLWGTQTNQVGDSVAKIFDTSSDGGRIVVYQKTDGTNSNADVNIYATEVLGVFQTGISENAVTVWDHIWNPYYFTGGGAAEGAYSEEAAPEGFTKTTEYTWTGKDFAGKMGHFNNSDISGYSDIWFAMKAAAPGNIYLQGAPSSGTITGEWVYVHYHQVSDGVWTKDYRTASGFYSPSTKHVNIEGTKLTDMISWKSGVNQGSYPTVADGVTEAATAYFTEVIGVPKA
ncbi:MAG: InlB B-repeat-containing protein [Clostridia bacterium]|nr:InlB B-repeat-containing protein [Clostridia bacterium]